MKKPDLSYGLLADMALGVVFMLFLLFIFVILPILLFCLTANF